MKVPAFIIPILILGFAALSYPLKEAFNVPAVQQTFAAADAAQGSLKEATLIVDGVRCQRTASFFTARFQNLPGLIEITAFAADRKVLLKFDPTKLNQETITKIAEEPVQGRDGKLYEVFKVIEYSER